MQYSDKLAYGGYAAGLLTGNFITPAIGLVTKGLQDIDFINGSKTLDYIRVGALTLTGLELLLGAPGTFATIPGFFHTAGGLATMASLYHDLNKYSITHNPLGNAIRNLASLVKEKYYELKEQ